MKAKLGVIQGEVVFLLLSITASLNSKVYWHRN